MFFLTETHWALCVGHVVYQSVEELRNKPVDNRFGFFVDLTHPAAPWLWGRLIL